jgi:hypothetical protein
MSILSINPFAFFFFFIPPHQKRNLFVTEDCFPEFSLSQTSSQGSMTPSALASQSSQQQLYSTLIDIDKFGHRAQQRQKGPSGQSFVHHQHNDSQPSLSQPLLQRGVGASPVVPLASSTASHHARTPHLESSIATKEARLARAREQRERFLAQQQQSQSQNQAHVDFSQQQKDQLELQTSNPSQGPTLTSSHLDTPHKATDCTPPSVAVASLLLMNDKVARPIDPANKDMISSFNHTSTFLQSRKPFPSEDYQRPTSGVSRIVLDSDNHNGSEVFSASVSRPMKSTAGNVIELEDSDEETLPLKSDSLFEQFSFQPQTVGSAEILYAGWFSAYLVQSEA